MPTDGSEDGRRGNQTRIGHCKADETDTYAGRGRGGRHMLSIGKPFNRGWLGNPFTTESHSREESIQKFREAFESKLQRDEEFREAVATLSGDVLGCWCQHLADDEPACHAEVIAEWADRLDEERGWRDRDACERCGESDHVVRAVKVKNRDRRELLCYGCFVAARSEGRVSPDDERVDGSATTLREVSVDGE